jgi:thymidine phosphorylase
MPNKYHITSIDGKLTINTRIDPEYLNRRLNEISKAFNIKTLVVLDPKGRIINWVYSEAVHVREQTEELLVKDFRHDWQEGMGEIITQMMTSGDIDMTEEQIRNAAWSHMREEYLENYLHELGKIIKVKSQLWNEGE